ncbi:MAG TPA: hypothetical protein VFO07_10680, partial [Roseiflexaceae bacterium]|nr:hypothetical protein [Roseiflexaceae bacterium]
LPGGHVGIVAGRRATDELWPRLADWLIAHAMPSPAVEPPPALRHDPSDISAALRAGIAVAHQIDTTQTALEMTSPLEAMQEIQLAKPGADPSTQDGSL